MALLVPFGSAYSENGIAHTAAVGGDYILRTGEFLVSKNATGLNLTAANTGYNLTIEGIVRGGGVGSAIFQFPFNSSLFLLVAETGGIHGSFGITSNSNAVLINKGIISTTTISIATSAVFNMTNEGLISSSGNDAVSAQGNQPHTIINKGKIFAPAGFEAITSPNDAVDTVTNSGMISGDVNLGGGNDAYLGVSGRMLGAVFGAAGNDRIVGGIDNDRFEGGDGNDTLTGNKGRDSLKGDAGDDKLEGGLGRDMLWGGAGRDNFIFKSPVVAANADTIYDFNRRDDTIQIDNAVFKKVGANGTLKAAAFKLGKAATDADDRIIYDKATGRVFYDPDGDGAQRQVLVATLANKVAINHLDFQVI